MNDDPLQEIKEDVRELKSWLVRHEERHGDDAAMLQLVLKHQTEHSTNHHGRSSVLRQASWVTVVTAVLLAIAEVIRYLVGF